MFPEKDNDSSFVIRTNEAIAALLQLSPESNPVPEVVDVSGGDIEDGGMDITDVAGGNDGIDVSDRIEGGDVDEDGVEGDDAENGGLAEFCHVDLVDILNRFDGQGLHNVLAYNVMAHIENSMKIWCRLHWSRNRQAVIDS